jgi:hypothetical protein
MNDYKRNFRPRLYKGMKPFYAIRFAVGKFQPRRKGERGKCISKE